MSRTEDEAPQATGSNQGMGVAFLVFAIALLVAWNKTGNWKLLVMALALAIAGGAAMLARKLSALPKTAEGAAHIGLGATVAKGALVEPGATVEMGATVRSGAVVRAGAVVRMGAVVGKNAVIERGAVVSWGAVVRKGAVVGEQAVVGAGGEVGPGARVPRQMSLSPGAVFSAGPEAPALPAAAVAPVEAVADPAEARVALACRKLEEELAASPEQVREFLGASNVTIASLRTTCNDLFRRERALRAQADPAALARLDQERAAVQARLASERDEHIRRSLEGALSAIDEQKRQRGLLVLAADRLQAEHTRLLYTLEGLAAQVVRMRSAGESSAPPASAELEHSVLQLRGEIDAISEALDEVSAPPKIRG